MAIDRRLTGIGGLMGAAGVALGAQAAHGSGAFTQTISNMLLFHAAALVGIGLSQEVSVNRVLKIAATILLFGVALFSLDLYVRDHGMLRLFPFAAPIGGTAMILGWFGIAASALVSRP